MIVIEAFIDGNIAIVVASIAAELITLFLGRQRNTLGSTSLKADVLITTQTPAADCRGPFFIGDAVTVIVGVIARGIDGNAWFKGDTFDLLACDTGGFRLTRAETTAGRGVVLVDLAITVVIDSVAVIIGSGIGLSGKAGAFFQYIWCCEGPVTAFNCNLRIGWDILSGTVKAVVDGNDQAFTLGEEVAGGIDPSFDSSIGNCAHEL